MNNNYTIFVNDVDLKTIDQIVEISNARLAGNGANSLPIPYSAPEHSFIYKVCKIILNLFPNSK